MNQLTGEELGELIEWMEDHRAQHYLKLLTERQELLVSTLIEKNDDELRGRIEELGYMASIHDRAIQQIQDLRKAQKIVDGQNPST